MMNLQIGITILYCQNPDLFQSFSINLDSDYIVDWWEDYSYLYDDFDSPYMEIKNDPTKNDSQ